ncbi:hypothetical protein VV02_12855 [Luteipulveratus mongoliensis]|uniref:DUF402 domain-containing protein n=2 Tax=Luteipulveratus mongoliensis TaxID=571913 RepID=A0A0K1JIJ3_9MICO|nr:hypothetical protein VV02_12855 [Luteipulveratus mongoliensis]
MRVVRDDEAGLVVWLAPGTRCLVGRYPDGSGGHSGPLERRFLRAHEIVQARVAWHGAGTLRIAPTGKPWSVWLFHDEDGTFAGWYVNLENPCQRDGSDVFTTDHILDLWIEADGTINMKDEDELQAATEQGRLTPAEADEIRTYGEAARASYVAGDWPFDRAWTTWHPDPAWTMPALPENARWTLDLTTDVPAP